MAGGIRKCQHGPGLTGILVANPAIDYQVNNSYFVLGHYLGQVGGRLEGAFEFYATEMLPRARKG